MCCKFYIIYFLCILVLVSCYCDGDGLCCDEMGVCWGGVKLVCFICCIVVYVYNILLFFIFVEDVGGRCIFKCVSVFLVNVLVLVYYVFIIVFFLLY